MDKALRENPTLLNRLRAGYITLETIRLLAYYGSQEAQTILGGVPCTWGEQNEPYHCLPHLVDHNPNEGNCIPAALRPWLRGLQNLIIPWMGWIPTEKPCASCDRMMCPCRRQVTKPKLYLIAGTLAVGRTVLDLHTIATRTVTRYPMTYSRYHRATDTLDACEDWVKCPCEKHWTEWQDAWIDLDWMVRPNGRCDTINPMLVAAQLIDNVKEIICAEGLKWIEH